MNTRLILFASIVFAIALVPQAATAAPAEPAGTRVAVGNNFSCAIRNDQKPVCWGDRTLTATQVPSDIGAVRSLSAGYSYTCAITLSDEVICWGGNPNGERAVPEEVDTVTDLDAGSSHACVVTTDAAAICWGYGSAAVVPDDLGTVKSIAAGGAHTCAVLSDDSLRCWGNDYYGQADPPDDLGSVKAVSTGDTSTCAIKTDGTPVCWGNYADGGTTVPGDIGQVKAIDVGNSRVCAIKSDAMIVCWGHNSFVMVPAGTYTQVSVGSHQNCAIKSDGNAICWLGGDPTYLGGSPSFASSPPSRPVGKEIFYAPLVVSSPGILPISFSISSGTLPPGITMTPSGVITGYATTDGVYEFTVEASNGVFESAKQSISLSVDVTPPPAPKITSTNSPAPSPGVNVRGEAEDGSTVRFFNSPDCTGAATVAGPAELFADGRFWMNVGPSTSTSISVDAIDSLGNVSQCSAPVTVVTYIPSVKTRFATPKIAAKRENKRGGKLRLSGRIYLNSSLKQEQCDGSVRVVVSAKSKKKKTVRLVTKSFALKWSGNLCGASSALTVAGSHKGRQLTFKMTLVGASYVSAPELTFKQKV